MGWFTDLGNFAGGVSQGLNQGQEMRVRALQIQQYQMQLDAAKRDLAARASVFQGMDGGGTAGIAGNFSGGPGGNALPAPQGPQGPGGGPGGGPMGPQGAPGGMPMAPSAMAPGGGIQRQSSPMAAQPAGRWGVPPSMAGGPQGGPGGQGPAGAQAQGGGPQTPFQTMMMIAKDIKSRNPQIQPLQLADAVSATIDMMKGLTPDYRADMQMLLQQMRDTAAEQRTQEHEAGATQREREGGQTKVEITGMQQQGADRREAMRAGERLAEIKARGDQKSREIVLTQTFINDRAARGQITKAQAEAQRAREKALSDKLKAATSRLDTLISSGSTDQDQIDKARDEYEQAEEDYSVFQGRIGYGEGGGPAAMARPGTGPNPRGGKRAPAVRPKTVDYGSLPP